jgi:aliphatic nitrilase
MNSFNFEIVGIVGMGDELQKVKLAAVQAASVFLDREATVEKACALIREAGSNGADIIGFPEGFIPAHPTWYGYLPTGGGKSGPLARRLFENAVEIPGPATGLLSAACKDGGIAAVIGVCEKRSGTTGTMYNTQLFIGADGKVLGKHQKLAPTVGERLVHAGGWGDTLTTFEMPFGNVSGLICAENSNPLATYVLLAMNTIVHVASWPPHFGGGRSMQDTMMAVTPGLAYTLCAFVINSGGMVTDEMIDLYATTDADRVYLESLKDLGSASIIGPSGNVVAGPMGPGEGILYAEVDLNDVVAAKMHHDFAGHYNRFDVFSVTVNRRAPTPLNESNGETNEGDVVGNDQ